MRLTALIAVLAGAVLVTAPALAHRVHAGVTEISVNPRTEEMEIIHRVFAHDLVEALGHDDRDAADFFADPEGQAEIGAYFGTMFRFANSDGALFELEFVGAEVDGEFGWIYFSAAAPSDPSAFIVDNDVLAEHFDDQVMMTNLRFNSHVRTAMQGPGRRAPVRLRFD